MSDTVNGRADSVRKTWTKPEVGMPVPVERTRGGIGDPDDQDDVFYNLS